MMQMLNVLMKVTNPRCLMDSKYFLSTMLRADHRVFKGLIYQEDTLISCGHVFSCYTCTGEPVENLCEV